MPDTKHMRWVDDFSTEAEEESKAEDAKLDQPEPAANDADGWQQYRHWINKAPAPRGRRAGIDPALYPWKAYRDWSEQVKRNWAKDRDQD